MFNNEKILVVKKDGYNIWAEVNSKTKKLFNFSVSGLGANPRTTYPHISSAEKLIKYLTEGNNKK